MNSVTISSVTLPELQQKYPSHNLSLQCPASAFVIRTKCKWILDNIWVPQQSSAFPSDHPAALLQELTDTGMAQSAAKEKEITELN